MLEVLVQIRQLRRRRVVITRVNFYSLIWFKAPARGSQGSLMIDPLDPSLFLLVAQRTVLNHRLRIVLFAQVWITRVTSVAILQSVPLHYWV